MVRNAGWFGGARVILPLTGVITIKLLDPITYGALLVISSSYGVVAQWIGWRSWEMTVKHVAQFREVGDRRRIAVVTRLAYLLDFGAGILTWLLLVLFSRWGATRILGDPSLAGLLAIYGLAGIAQAPYYTSNAVLRACDRFRTIFWIEITYSSLRLVGVLVIAFVPVPRRLAAFVCLHVLAFAVQGLLTWWQSRRALGPLPRLPWGLQLWDEMAGYRTAVGGTLASSNVTSKLRPLYRGSDVLLLSAWCGGVAVGLFSAARKVSDIVSLLAPAAQGPLGPELSKMWGTGRYRQAAELVFRSCLLIGAVCVVAACLAGFLAGPFLAWWQPDYLGALPALYWLLGAVVLLVFGSPLYTALMSTHKPWLATVGYAATIAMQWVLLLTLLRAELRAEAGPAALAATAASAVALAAGGGQIVYAALFRFAILDAERAGGPVSPAVDGEHGVTGDPLVDLDPARQD